MASRRSVDLPMPLRPTRPLRPCGAAKVRSRKTGRPSGQEKERCEKERACMKAPRGLDGKWTVARHEVWRPRALSLLPPCADLRGASDVKGSGGAYSRQAIGLLGK